MKTRKVICSTTVSGFVMPFDQNTFQIRSIELFASADSIGYSIRYSPRDTRPAKMASSYHSLTRDNK